ncbi:MAG: sialidase family protein [Bryobacteraceae bacterium]
MKTLALFALSLGILAAEDPFFKSELIFPLEKWHNHASCIVELPNRDLFVVWFHGSGERKADDVKVEGARLVKGRDKWSPVYDIVDTPGFPDTNPSMFLDNDKRLWLLWPVIIANEWETALMKYKISTDYSKPGAPAWGEGDTMLFIPRNFAASAKRQLEEFPESPDRTRMLERAANKYFSRLGWMTRAHPIQLASGRILVPLYSDGYSFSLVAMSDDNGKSWQTSEPIVGGGNIQPSIVVKKDGTLVTYMRDNGPPPKRVHMATSKDDGVTWSKVVDSDVPNPGSGMEAIVLRDGSWAMIFNDLEKGRYSLAVAISDDEGVTWKWKRHIERDDRGQGASSFHYPSIIQAQDGTLHASYSYFLNHLPEGADRKSIKHAHFNIEWVKEPQK